MTIPFRVKKLTKTAKAPTKENSGDLWDLYADDFCVKNLIIREYPKHVCEKIGKYQDIDNNNIFINDNTQEVIIEPQGRILVKTGISLELPKQINNIAVYGKRKPWVYGDLETYTKYPNESLIAYAVADIRPRSGLALKHGITVLNSPGTIDNSYRKEVGVIIYNAGHEPYTITKGDKIAQMLIRPLYPSKMEIVEDIEDTGRGGYGSTGK